MHKMEQKQISQAAIAVWQTTKNNFLENQILNVVDQLLEANEKIKSLEAELEIERQRFKSLEEQYRPINNGN